ncbi:hypothetical protein APT65_00053 [Trabzonvirus APT65]|uniref:Endonuclease VII n=1 Tax=Aeromonas phage APT65 TaxID=2982914 RepID=A0A9E8JZN9_9CAUD|nr:hypothetical protein APT65_00053 [Aeromonas phage APT65]
MKICGSCKEEKPFDSFSKKSKSKDGYSSKCKICHNEYVRNIWYVKNKDRHIKSVNSYKKNNPNRVLSTRYGIEESIISEIMSVGKCEICESTFDLVFDHIHKTNEARGCLCRNCNTAIGMFGDTSEEIKAKLNGFMKYLEK